MKLISYKSGNDDRVAILFNEKVYPLAGLDGDLPLDMSSLLRMDDGLDRARLIYEVIVAGNYEDKALKLSDVQLLAPVPHPTSTRDAYAFRQHVATARRNRGVDMIPEFDQFPVFYFTNHHAVYGPGEVELMPDHFQRLDFELEVAVVIGKKGRNIKASEADGYIAGYMIMNDLSARQLQMEEMKLNLGPAKGKDFANCFGPYLVTPDELEDKVVPAKPEHTGKQYNLKMKAFHNGELISEGNFADMDWSFSEIIERISYGVDIFPGEVIGSGTVGTGCYLELNGSRKLENPDYVPVWIKEGDEMTLEVESLGKLTNKFVKAKTDYSLLALKKTNQ